MNLCGLTENLWKGTPEDRPERSELRAATLRVGARAKSERDRERERERVSKRESDRLRD